MHRVPRSLCLLSMAVSLSAVASKNAHAATCADLQSLKLPSATISKTIEVPAGTFTPTYEKAPAKIYSATVPAFCRVIGVIHPVPESTIGFEVWLPVAKAWNHRIEGTGNGAYSGRISYGGLENAIALGYAVSSTDTGHSGSDVKFAIDHPERIVDWGNRAVHETAKVAAPIVAAYYGTSATHAYFNGCSTGGHQALQEAQRYPEDYDGILAGDAGNARVHLNVGFLWGFAAAHDGDKLVLPESKLQVLHDAAIKACDASDGVKDGILEDPLSCHFDPGVLACKASATGDDCLSPREIEAARKIYAGPKNPHTGEQIIAGLMPGSEIVHGGEYKGWQNFITAPTEPSRLDVWKYWVFNNPNWDWHTFDYDHDVATGDAKMALVNATNPDLRPFAQRGGKLLVYHGWVDPVGPPLDAIHYHRSVEKVVGPEKTAAFYRLFMVPGMSHCNGGDGYELAGGARGIDDPDGVPQWPHPDASHDMLNALDAWVTRGAAPTQLIAAHYENGKPTRTIPVCAFPKVARYTGKGSTDDAANYTCTSPKH